MAVINVVNYLIAPVVTFYLLRLLFPPESKLPSPLPDTYNETVYNWMPAKHPEVICYQSYTPHELAKFDGKQEGGRILLAIMNVGVDGKVGAKLERTVFDVSNGRNFYGPDGMYGNFAGRDASRGMAKQSFDEDMLTDLDKPLDDLADLNQSEIDNMRGWHQHFTNKYPVVGELVQ